MTGDSFLRLPVFGFFKRLGAPTFFNDTATTEIYTGCTGTQVLCCNCQ
jgi:hypothetical protein